MRVISPPTALPVTVQTLAEQLHIVAEDNAAQLEGLLRAATATVEVATNRPIMQRTVEIALPEEIWTEWWFPCAPVAGLVEAEGLSLKYGFDEPRLIRSPHCEAEVVRATVGYADLAEVPAQLLEAIQLMAMEWYYAKVTIEAQYQAPLISFSVTRLIKQMRYRRPWEWR